MSKREDGGPAFPRMLAFVESQEQVMSVGTDLGISIRDYFAAKAMQAIRGDSEFVLRHDPEQVADRAYELADAMLAERAK